MVTQCGIPPGENFTYVWETNNQYGTFWIHGHTRHQEVEGLHTPLIIHSREKPKVDYDEELLMTFEDWFSTEFIVRQAYIDSLEDVRKADLFYPVALINGYDGNNTAPIKFVPGKRIPGPPPVYRKSGLSPIRRDTVQVLAREYIRVRFRADNPGIWRVHSPDVLQQRQKVSVEMLRMCERQGIKTSGNGAGNQGFDLSGLPPAIYLTE
ncbi:hypothetical protein GGF43_001521 [Coemansia sp. RSA 2618]|nr:hypothetical protein GGF43_001521 [Coemansia sp. RSA 2618]